MTRWVAGVDGCKGGWVAAFRNLDDRDDVWSGFFRRIEDVCDSARAPVQVTVDIPIGLLDRVQGGGRAAEVEARRVLGPMRSSVFSTSARAVVYAGDHAAAVRMVSEQGHLQPFKPSIQAAAIFPRIREVDELLTRRPDLRSRIREVHPELAFWSLNGDQPLQHSKKSAAGIQERKALLSPHFGTAVIEAKRSPGIKVDDYLDALAALVVADALARGLARSFSATPQGDGEGIEAAIWTLGRTASGTATVAASGVDGAAIEAAAAHIAGHVRVTPAWSLPPGAFGQPGPAGLKLELFQHAGSFKARGAFNSLLSLPVPEAGVAAASGGNHGAAVAFAARALGHPARIFVPEISGAAKVAAIRAFGAQVVIGGARYADAQEACDRYVAATGALRIHPFDAEATIAGQGTLAREWEGQDPDLDTVLVAVGGGGLISGMAAWWRGRGPRVVGVEPEGSRALHAALASGGPVDVEVQSVAADSLGARNVGDRVYGICRGAVERVVLVPDAAIVEAQARLWRDWRIACEPGGATALAALLCGAYRSAPGERVGILVCGGNVDLARLADIA